MCYLYRNYSRVLIDGTQQQQQELDTDERLLEKKKKKKASFTNTGLNSFIQNHKWIVNKLKL